MSNLSFSINNPFSLLPSVASLDMLLDSLGFNTWITVTSSFVLPIMSLIGTILCSLSAYIFFHRRFINPIYFYYRLLCIVYIVHLIHGIPFGLVFSPRYFPRINTYVSSIYLIYYVNISSILYHFEGLLQIAILLDRIKIFSPFVNRYFTTSPLKTSIILFLACIFIDFSTAFSLKINSFGTYTCIDYLDDHSTKRHIENFYFFEASEFILKPIGLAYSCFTFFFNLIFTLFAGVFLNLISVHKFKCYVRKRNREAEQQELLSIHNRPILRREVEQRKTTERTKCQIEKNMFYMAATLCSILVVSRVFFIFCYIYFFLFYVSFFGNLVLCLFTYLILTLIPTGSLIIFISFNKMFRDTFWSIFKNEENSTPENSAGPIDTY